MKPQRSQLKKYLDILNTIRNNKPIISVISRNANLSHYDAVLALNKLINCDLVTKKLESHTDRSQKRTTYHLTDKGLAFLMNLEQFYEKTTKLEIDVI